MGISVPWRILEDEPSMSPRDERKLKGAEVTIKLLTKSQSCSEHTFIQIFEYSSTSRTKLNGECVTIHKNSHVIPLFSRDIHCD